VLVEVEQKIMGILHQKCKCLSKRSRA